MAMAKLTEQQEILLRKWETYTDEQVEIFHQANLLFHTMLLTHSGDSLYTELVEELGLVLKLRWQGHQPDKSRKNVGDYLKQLHCHWDRRDVADVEAILFIQEKTHQYAMDELGESPIDPLQLAAMRFYITQRHIVERKKAQAG